VTAGDLPTLDEVLGYFTACSNWGRWGAEDQLGTLNHTTDEHRRAAAALVTAGRAVSLARLIPTRTSPPDLRPAPLHAMLSSGDAYDGQPTPIGGAQGSADVITLAPHGFGMTHVDALSHVFRDGKMYNGRSASLVSTAEGATSNAVTVWRDGLVGRGVLLDVAAARGVEWVEPGDPITTADLEAAEELAATRIRTGDIVLVRTGAAALHRAHGPSPTVYQTRIGMHVSCAPWLHSREAAVLCCDSAQDVHPSGYESLRAPLHQVAVVAMGLCLIDNCDFERLALVVDEVGRSEFLFSAGPLLIENGTGSPINPLALF
jgi:kynurenine formamidase